MLICFTKKFVICSCLVAVNSAIIASPYGHGVVSTEIPERTENKTQIKNKNSEMLKQFARFLEQSEQIDTKTQKTAPRIRDKNFGIIDGGSDELRKIFDSHPEVLIQHPDDFKLVIACISNSIFERKAIFQDVMFQPSEIVDKAVTALSGILGEYTDIIPQIRALVMLLRCTDVISGTNPSIIDALRNKDNTVPLISSDAEEVYSKIKPMIKYSPERMQAMMKSLFFDAVKTRFEDKPNIPSYYIFHLMNNILEKLEKTEKDMKKPTFNRSFENAIYTMQKLLGDMDNFAKSDQVAKNMVPFLDGARKTMISQVDLIQKIAKGWQEYLMTLEVVTRQVKNTLKRIIETEKDQSIFDNVDEEYPF